MLDLHAEANYCGRGVAAAGGAHAAEGHSRAAARSRPHGRVADMRFTLARASASEAWRFDARQVSRHGLRAGRPRARSARPERLAHRQRSGGALDHRHAFRGLQLARSVSGADRAAVLKSTLYWRRNPQEVLLASSDLELRTHAASVRAKLAWSQPADGSSPCSPWRASSTTATSPMRALYFPHQLLPPPALQWLDRAFVSGHLPHATAVFAGSGAALSIPRRRGTLPDSLQRRARDAGLSTGLAAPRECRGAGRVP